MKKLLVNIIDCTGWFDIEKYPKVLNTTGVVFMGKTCITNSDHIVRYKDKDDFLTILKEIIKSDYFEGFLTVPLSMNLASKDVKRDIFVGQDLRPIPEHASYIRHGLLWKFKKENRKAKEKNIQYRIMLLAYFKSKIPGEEINNKFGLPLCNKESEIPKMW